MSPEQIISFNCPGCQKGLRVKQDMAGRNVKCPVCMAVIQIPDMETMPTQPIPIVEPISAPKPAPRPVQSSRMIPAVKQQQTPAAKPGQSSRVIPAIKQQQTPAARPGQSSRMIPAIKQPDRPVTGKMSSVRLKAGASQILPKEGVSVKNKKTLMIAGGAVAGVIIIILIAVFMSAQSETKQKEILDNKKRVTEKQDQDEREAREQKAKDFIKEIDRIENSAGIDYKSVLNKIKNNESDVKGTPYEKDIAAKKEEIKQKLDVLRVVNETKSDFESNPNDFARIIKQYDKLKEDAKVIRNTNALVDEIERLKAVVVDAQKKEFDTALASIESNVNSMMEKNEFKNALAECKKALEKFPDAKDTIENKISNIKQAESEYLRKRYDWQVLYDGSGTLGWNSQNCNVFIDTDGLGIENKTGGQGFATVGEAEWQNYTFEMSYKIVQGAARILVRFDLSKGNNQVVIPIARKFGNSWEKLIVTISDDQITFKQGDGAAQTISVPDNTPSRGKIGFLLNPGERMLIKDMKAKLIR
ncbi:MAG: hypothetical protein V1701_07550 [Planctomycetota bacterium]